MAPQRDPLETDKRFPSCEWVGFYLQPKLTPQRCLMELCLTFQGGTFAGEGRDAVGEFLILGRYNLENGAVNFTKYYIGQHTVDCRGWNEGKGIWGIWEIRPGLLGGSYDRGGFHIWPRAMGDPTGAREAAESERPRNTERVLVE